MELKDFSTVAVPRPSGRDTALLRALARERFGLGPVRQPTEQLLGMSIEYETGESSERGDDLIPAPKDYASIPMIELALRNWPLSLTVCELADSWTPLLIKTGPAGRGCCSGHTHPKQNDGRIHIFTTVEDPTGSAEGIVHEIAHQRLHCLGVDLEEHDGTLLDEPLQPPVTLFSPIRREVPRPVTALLHGIYAWTFMLEIDIANAHDDLGYLSRNIPKTRDGLATLRQYAHWTSAGQAFFDEFCSWSLRLIHHGEALLDRSGFTETPYPPKEW